MFSSNSDSDGAPVAGPSRPKKQKYSQKYKEEWEKIAEFKGWLCRSKKGQHFARCVSCDKDINISSGKDSLIKHKCSKFHCDKLKMVRNQPRITDFSDNLSEARQLKENIAEGEIRLSAFVAEHNLPFLVMDHLPKLIAKICHDSKIAQGLACGRKKTTAIVRYVLGSESFINLCQDLRKTKFSLIIDESTDRSTQKHLCLIVRYLKNNNVQDNFFGIIQLNAADANTLYNHIISFFSTNSIPYKDNMIGFASDGANVMMGKHHSVMTLLKNDIPHLYIMKCICHSFHLCASYACQKLPKHVEDLTRDIFNYFSSSPKRIAELKEYQLFCNIKIHKILHPSQTRWLSVHQVIHRILEQFGALQLYFTSAVAEGDVSAAETILQNLNNPLNKLYLLFLDYVLPFFNNLNREMQSEAPKLHLLYTNICNILRTLSDCYLKREYVTATPLDNIDFKNPANFLQLDDIYLGSSVALYLQESNLNSEQINFFKIRCLDFYIESCQQIILRFPLKNNPTKKFKFINPTVVKNGSISSISDIGSLFPNIVSREELQNLDSEWRSLRNYEECLTFSDDVNEFWTNVKQVTRGDSTYMFPVLSRFVENLLCLPHSSANVERIFSAINLMKTKQRNQLSAESITGLLHTKTYINKKNCFTFEIEKKLIASMNDNILKNLQAE